MRRNLALIEAPSNLGLAPPAPGKEPGARRMARVLRQLGLRTALGAADGGEVVMPCRPHTRLGKMFAGAGMFNRADCQNCMKSHGERSRRGRARCIRDVIGFGPTAPDPG